MLAVGYKLKGMPNPTSADVCLRQNHVKNFENPVKLDRWMKLPCLHVPSNRCEHNALVPREARRCVRQNSLVEPITLRISNSLYVDGLLTDLK